jgi:proline iminopeptidase
VHGLILRGIFLCRPQEIEWFYQAGASRLFPDYWQDYIAPIPLDERDDLLSAFHKRLTGNDQIAQMHAAKAWSTWEGRTATLRPNPLVVDRFSEPQRALSIARIECHYFTNNAFLEPNQLIRDMGKIAHLPGVIIHGRYDVICPLDNAWELHQAWPNSELQVIRDAGHAASEPGITDAGACRRATWPGACSTCRPKKHEGAAAARARCAGRSRGRNSRRGRSGFAGAGGGRTRRHPCQCRQTSA